jgi:hypothetical protein
VWFNNNLIIDNWAGLPYSGPAITDTAAPVRLVAGEKYDIKIEYYEKQGSASAQLYWSSNSVPYQIVPTNLLYSNINSPPTTVVDNYMTPKNPGGISPIVLTVPAWQGVLANDSDPSGYPLTAVLVTQAAHGSATLNADGSFTYTPTAGYSGPDSFRYWADDGYSTSNATGTVVNLLVDAPPVVNAIHVNASQYGTGLQGDYYQYGAGGVDWADLKLSRSDADIEFNWGVESPDPALAADKFSIRWTGEVQAEFSETHTFYTQSAGGVRLWVNNQLLIDHWTDHASAEDSGTIALLAGRRYDIKIEYFKDTGPGQLTLRWSSPSTSKQVPSSDDLFNPQPLRTAGGVDPSGRGIQVITVNLSKPVTFAADDVLLQRVTFDGNTETVLGTVTPLNVEGFRLKWIKIILPQDAVVDSWLKVTLKGGGTLQASGNLNLRLDGEPKAGGSGAPFIYDGSTDLPTGNGAQGGDAVFYVGSLRGDFNADNHVTADDVDAFFTEFMAGSKDADFRGNDPAETAPDGKVTPADIGSFIALYNRAAVEGHHLAPLPSTGPTSDGDPQPLAALPAAPAATTDAATTPAAPAPADDPTTADAEVDVLAMVPKIAAAATPDQPLAAAAAADDDPATPASPAFETVLTVEPPATTQVPLASGAAAEPAPTTADPTLQPDGGVDLLALTPLGLTLV